MPSPFLPSVCVHNDTEGEERERSWSIYHMSGFGGGGGGEIQILHLKMSFLLVVLITLRSRVKNCIRVL